MNDEVLNQLLKLSQIYSHVSNGEMATSSAKHAIELLEDMIEDLTNQLAKQKEL